MLTLDSTVTLNSGTKMPLFGLGVFLAKEKAELINAIKVAVKAGYRSIDTAMIYRNEEFVGEAIKELIDEGVVTREELFITSKLWGTDFGDDEKVAAAYAASLERLGLDYLDLYLIHWPGQDESLYLSSWKVLENLYKAGKIKAIGVSNFEIHHLETLAANGLMLPAVNQIEYHPRLTQEPLHKYLTEKGIYLEAWSPLMRGKELFDTPELIEIAEVHGKTVAQIVLRWNVQSDIITIPKSVTPSRIIENASIYDFELTDAEMEKISALNEDRRIGPAPDDFAY